MRHGYFLPLQDKLCGDMEFANESKELYDSLGFTKECDHNKCSQGQACGARYYKYAGRFDGVSIFQRDSGEIVKRVCLQDFFSTEHKVLVKDHPFTENGK
jgi:hypothetical protein